MNPWAEILRIFHSALIDELNDRLPESKPELGLPKKSSGFGESAEFFLICEIGVGSRKGYLTFEYEKTFESECRLKIGEFWKNVGTRAAPRFPEIALAPKIESTSFFHEQSPELERVLERLALTRQTVRMPIRVGSSQCNLGLAV